MDNKIETIILILLAFAVIIVISILTPPILYSFGKGLESYLQEVYIVNVNQINMINISNSSKEAISNVINSTYQNLTLLINNLTNNG